MFEQSVLEARAMAARPWSLAVSLAGQGFLITAAVLVPLVHPDVLQRASFWIPTVGPPRTYRSPAPAKLDVVRPMSEHRTFVPTALTEPMAIPKTVTMLQDPPPEVTGGAMGEATGVIGGTGDPMATSRVLETISKLPPPAAPKAVETVVKEAPPKPATIPRLKIGGEVQAAKLIFSPAPVYPLLAKQARVQGVVRIYAVIATDGRIAGLRVLNGHPLLVTSAMDAVKRWVYKPTLLNGDPVEVVTEITVTFTLNH